MCPITAGRQGHGIMILAVLMASDADIAVSHIRLIIVSVNRDSIQIRARRGQRSGAVAVMKIQIKDSHLRNFSSGLQGVRGNDQSVEGAEAFSVVGACMMKPAG